jgi:DNA-binding response OmpR family regulator
VLYISGDREGRIQFAKIVRRWKNMRLVVVESARSGFQIAMDHRLRLVVMDDPLPGIDAAELVTHLRRRELPIETPIMILAQDPGPRDRARLMWAGASAIHSKPLDVAEVDRTVMVLMEIATLR